MKTKEVKNQPKPFSKRKAKYIKDNYPQKSIAEISIELKCTYSKVYNFLERRGLVKKTNHNISTSSATKILRLYVEGWNLKDISDETGYNIEPIKRVIKKVFVDAKFEEEVERDSYTGMTINQVLAEQAFKDANEIREQIYIEESN